ncbi:hypothetical protein [Paraburkholderia graminis]|nr:hypothetical protein [Paraburkholderia graminis]
MDAVLSKCLYFFIASPVTVYNAYYVEVMKLLVISKRTDACPSG